MTYKFQNLYMKKILTSFATVITCFFVSACSDDSDVMKKGILEAQSNSKNKTISLDMNKFSKNKIIKICVQNPYMTHQLFEKEVGNRVSHFSDVDAPFFTLWFFHEQSPPTQIKFHKGLEINLRSPGVSICVASSTVYLANLQLSFVSD